MKELLHFISGSLHILSAVTWVGAMIFNQYGVKPALKPLGSPKAHAVGGMAAHKFSSLTWTSLALLIITGLFAVFSEVDKFKNLFTEPPGTILTAKLILVAAMIIILLYQVYYYGPRMKYLINPATPKTVENQREMNFTGKVMEGLSKVHLLIGVTIIILAVVLAQTLEK